MSASGTVPRIGRTWWTTAGSVWAAVGVVRKLVNDFVAAVIAVRDGRMSGHEQARDAVGLVKELAAKAGDAIMGAQPRARPATLLELFGVKFYLRAPASHGGLACLGASLKASH